MEPAICILGAVREEISGIRRQMTVHQQTKLGKADVWSGSWEGRPIVLVRTGIGKIRARDALSQVQGKFRPAMIVSIGYAGGADPRLRVGDLLVADKVLELPSADDGKSGNPPPLEIPIDPHLLRQAPREIPSLPASIFSGGLITVGEVVHDPKLKHEIGIQYSVLAIDMETAALARVAREKNLPFLSIRSITDTASQELFDVSSFLEKDGEISRLKAGWYVLTHPASLKSLKNLKDHAQLATRSLTDFLAAFLRVKSPNEIGKF